MELGVRDWMIIVGVLLILAVLMDGYRRVRNERRGKIRMSLNKQFLNSGEEEDVGEKERVQQKISSELPNGGARVVGRQGGGFERNEPELGELDELDLDQSVPMLMESVVSANIAGRLRETDLEQPVPGDLFDTEPQVAAGSQPGATESRQGAGARASAKPQKHRGPGSQTDEGASQAELPPESIAEPEPAEEPVPAYTGEQEIVVINVVARGEPFQGADLLHILLACDLRYGKMNIFHRYEHANGRGQVQFSVANSVEPGTFDLDAINDFSTPGVCFFMSVPGPEEAIQAFECMVETAQCLVKNLDGEMLDESRSAMTAQTLEHCRQRLQEFERRQLAQA